VINRITGSTWEVPEYFWSGDMYVTIRVRMDVALSLQRREPPKGAARELLEAAQELGVSLEPIHPRTEDPHLAPYFSIDVGDTAAADQAIKRFQRCGAVEGAYLKPHEEAP
jgi:hypothetical protein